MVRSGQVQPVLRSPHPVLSAVCPEVDPTSSATATLAADLLATMAVSPGCVGLAANQIGVSARVFCLDVSKHPKTKTCHGEFVAINPVIQSCTRKERGREGCMSVPDFTGDVRRGTRLVLTYTDLSGAQVRIETDAFEARAIQHEMDHLDGMLFLDRVAGAHAVHERQNYR